MKRVDTIARVRRAFYVQGWSVKRIVRELHVSRNTVRKILRTDETDFSYERERQPMPRIGPWQGQLEQFLSTNANKPSRERLTLIRIFEELRGLGYEGGYDAVRRFAKGWSQNRGAVTAEAYVNCPGFTGGQNSRRLARYGTLNRPGFTGGQNSRRIARYGTDIKEEDREAVFTRVPRTRGAAGDGTPR
jgi:transcriptional regulator with XRE-family HTH domain